MATRAPTTIPNASLFHQDSSKTYTYLNCHNRHVHRSYFSIFDAKHGTLKKVLGFRPSQNFQHRSRTPTSGAFFVLKINMSHRVTLCEYISHTQQTYRTTKLYLIQLAKKYILCYSKRGCTRDTTFEDFSRDLGVEQGVPRAALLSSDRFLYNHVETYTSGEFFNFTIRLS